LQILLLLIELGLLGLTRLVEGLTRPLARRRVVQRPLEIDGRDARGAWTRRGHGADQGAGDEAEPNGQTDATDERTKRARHDYLRGRTTRQMLSGQPLASAVGPATGQKKFPIVNSNTNGSSATPSGRI